jgi:hypothetical protein
LIQHGDQSERGRSFRNADSCSFHLRVAFVFIMCSR